MAYEFLGTFNQAMLDRLVTFARSQLPYLDARIAHLEAEVARMGVIVFRYVLGVPSGYAADPAESYLGRLLAAYEVLGGNPAVDLRIRLRNDPIYLLTGDVDVSPTTFSNGEVMTSKGLSDADSAELVRQLKIGFEPTLQRRFDRLERQLRRGVDYTDQLQIEIERLKLLKQVATVEGSFENLIGQLQELINDPNYRAISSDTSEHAELGRDIYAPFSSYDIPDGSGEDPNKVANRIAETPQRQGGVPIKPGQGKA